MDSVKHSESNFDLISSELSVRDDRITRLVRQPLFDVAMLILILCNAIVAGINLRWVGLRNAMSLGKRDNAGIYESYEGVIFSLFAMFEVFFVLEVIMRTWTYGWRHYCS